MSDAARLAAAAKALTVAGGSGGDLCAPFLDVLNLTGAAVSTLGDPFGSETVCASDDRAARLDEIQIDLGEGPCWEALRSHAPVLEPDLEHSTNTAWPLAMGSLRDTGLGAVFAFPLVVAGIDVGAIDLYSSAPLALTDDQIRDTTLLSMVLARQVLRRTVLALEEGSEDAEQGEGTYSRREVHQATGMIVAQMRITPQDALLVLRGHAFATGRSVLHVAADIIDRRLDFTAAD
jgi:hypothetical protein